MVIHSKNDSKRSSMDYCIILFFIFYEMQNPTIIDTTLHAFNFRTHAIMATNLHQ